MNFFVAERDAYSDVCDLSQNSYWIIRSSSEYEGKRLILKWSNIASKHLTFMITSENEQGWRASIKTTFVVTGNWFTKVTNGLRLDTMHCNPPQICRTPLKSLLIELFHLQSTVPFTLVTCGWGTKRWVSLVEVIAVTNLKNAQRGGTQQSLLEHRNLCDHWLVLWNLKLHWD